MQCIVTQEADFTEGGYEPIIPRHLHVLTHKSKLLPPMDLCEELIELYFRYVHVSFHVLFHKPSFLKAFRNGSLPKILLLAVIGLSARFSDHAQLVKLESRARGRAFTKEAERLLDLHNVSLTSVQACLLLGASAVVEGDGATESIYFSVACRMAMLLDLPNAPVMTRIQQEVNYRVSWAVFETDTWSATATRLPKMMPLRRVPLPMAERRFLELSPVALPERYHVESPGSPCFTVQTSRDSLIAQSVVVNQIFPRIDQINSQAVSGELQGDDFLEAVGQVSEELALWQAHLPENMQNTPENLIHWTREGFGNIFVIVHMNYHHLCQLLFYQFLHGESTQDSNPELRHKYSQRCVEHATDLCNLIYLASRTPGAELLNSIVGHVLTIASTVQLHKLLFNPLAAEMESARTLLQQNFEILTCLKTYWPCIDISFSRFNTFHKACLRSQDDSLFRMDHWMLTFILEFATPLGERFAYDFEDDPLEYMWPMISS